MGLRLRPKNPARYQVGNAIIYGGETHTNTFGPDKEPVCDIQVFYVESDFGNHMTLTWREIEEMWIVVGWQDYSDWLTNRDMLRMQPNLLMRATDEEDVSTSCTS